MTVKDHIELIEENEFIGLRIGDYSMLWNKNAEMSLTQLAFSIETLTNNYTRSQDSYFNDIVRWTKED